MWWVYLSPALPGHTPVKVREWRCGLRAGFSCLPVWLWWEGLQSLPTPQAMVVHRKMSCKTCLGCRSGPRPSRRTTSSKACALWQEGKLFSKQYGWDGRQVYRTNTNKTLHERLGLCRCVCQDTIRLRLSGLPAPEVLIFLRSRKTIPRNNDLFYFLRHKEDICNFSWHF